MKIQFRYTSLVIFCLTIGALSSARADSTLKSDCKLKVFEGKKWQSAELLLIDEEVLRTYPDPRSPQFLFFKHQGKFYAGLKSCFKESHPALTNPWLVFFGLGFTFLPQTNHNIPLDGVTSTSTTHDKGGIVFSVEALYHLSEQFGVSGVLESSKYSYAGDTSGSGDSHIAFLVAPRAEFILSDDFSLWAGAGTGLILSTIHGSTSTAGGLTVAGATQSMIGFDFSPRAGASYQFSEKNLLDLMIAYHTFGGGVSGTYSGSSSGSFTDSYSRNWITILLRFGVHL